MLERFCSMNVGESFGPGLRDISYSILLAQQCQKGDDYSRDGYHSRKYGTVFSWLAGGGGGMYPALIPLPPLELPV